MTTAQDTRTTQSADPLATAAMRLLGCLPDDAPAAPAESVSDDEIEELRALGVEAPGGYAGLTPAQWAVVERSVERRCTEERADRERGWAEERAAGEARRRAPRPTFGAQFAETLAPAKRTRRTKAATSAPAASAGPGLFEDPASARMYAARAFCKTLLRDHPHDYVAGSYLRHQTDPSWWERYAATRGQARKLVAALQALPITRVIQLDREASVEAQKRLGAI